MTDANELDALKARLNELEAAQSQAAPAGGFMGAVSLIGHVVSLVPRWLLVAAGVVFVAWLGLDLYLNARVKMAQTRAVEEKAETDRVNAVNERPIEGSYIKGPAVKKPAPTPELTGCPLNQRKSAGVCTPLDPNEYELAPVPPK